MNYLFKLFVTRIIPVLLIFGLFNSVFAQNAQKVFEKASPSVIILRTPDGKAQGSGVVFVVDRSGLSPLSTIITNCHVVEEYSSVIVERQRKNTKANVVFCDKERDIALLVAWGDLNQAEVRVLTREPLKVGEKVYAIGAPQGLELSLTEGIISQLRMTRLGNDPIIQMTAAISPGSSGGGLFDDRGRLIGITTNTITGSQSLNFAIPSSFVFSAASDFERRRKMSSDIEKPSESIISNNTPNQSGMSIAKVDPSCAVVMQMRERISTNLKTWLDRNNELERKLNSNSAYVILDNLGGGNITQQERKKLDALLAENNRLSVSLTQLETAVRSKCD